MWTLALALLLVVGIAAILVSLGAVGDLMMLSLLCLLFLSRALRAGLSSWRACRPRGDYP